MVTIKDRASFMSGHLHCYPFGNPCSYHIAHRGAPEIVDDLTWKTSLLASPTPTLVIVYNPMTMIMKDERDNLIAVPLWSKCILFLLLQNSTKPSSRHGWRIDSDKNSN